jgi:hypothetical protein
MVRLPSLLGEASGLEHAARVVRALPIVRRVLRSRDVPLIARIEADGVIGGPVRGRRASRFTAANQAEGRRRQRVSIGAGRAVGQHRP